MSSSTTVPSFYKHKIIKKTRADPFGYVNSLLLNLKGMDSTQLRQKELSFVQSIVVSAIRPVANIVFRSDPVNFRKFRYLTKFLRSYRFPPFLGQRRSRVTEYSRIFSSKQHIKRFYYYFREKQLRSFIRRSAPGRDLGQRENFVSHANNTLALSSRNYRVVRALEHRLSSVLLRSKFFITPFQIRQVIIHGHVFVNGKRVTSPHQVLSLGDNVTFSPLVINRIRENIVFYFRVLRWLRSPRGRFAKLVLRTFRDRRGNFPHPRGRYFKFLKISFVGFKRRIRRPFIPSHLDINYSLFSITIAAPIHLGTLYFPSRRSGSSFGQFLGFYGV